MNSGNTVTVVFDWAHLVGVLASICAMMSLGGYIVMVLIRSSLRNDFVDTLRFSEMESAMQSVTNRVGDIPSGLEFRNLSTRMGAVEVHIATVQETSQGNKEALSRIEHNVSLLTQHLLKEKR